MAVRHCMRLRSIDLAPDFAATRKRLQRTANYTARGGLPSVTIPSGLRIPDPGPRTRLSDRQRCVNRCADVMAHRTDSPVARRAAIVGGLYGALCLAVLFDVSLIPSLVADAIPGWFGVFLVSVTGPALLLADGGSTIFVAAWAGIAACAVFAWFCWRRFPDSEIGAVGVLGAVGIWILSGWLVVAAGI